MLMSQQLYDDLGRPTISLTKGFGCMLGCQKRCLHSLWAALMWIERASSYSFNNNFPKSFLRNKFDIMLACNNACTYWMPTYTYYSFSLIASLAMYFVMMTQKMFFSSTQILLFIFSKLHIILRQHHNHHNYHHNHHHFPSKQSLYEFESNEKISIFYLFH